MNKGILFALVTAIISGFSIYSNKFFVSQMDPVVFTTLKNLLVAIVLTVLITRPQLKSSFKKLTSTDWKKLIAIGIVGGSIPFALFFTGLSMTNATNAAVIHKTLFVWVALLAIPVLHERLNFKQMIGYVLVLWGVLWTTGLKFSGDTGELMIFAATILWAIENVIAKIALKSLPSELVAWSRMTIGSIILLAIVLLQGNAVKLISLSSAQLIAVVVGGAFLTGYVLTLYKALKSAPATVVSAILVLSTPITAALNAGFSTALVSSTFLITFALIIVGVFIIVKRASVIM